MDRGRRLKGSRSDRGKPSGALAKYRGMRRAGATPEPMGAGGARPGLFVVQQHGARRLHYDLRLEWRGALLSWAVPKGPSLDPDEKRLAVHVEDHPVEYADFEGVIPEGNYGAGEVILWDRGRWIPREDPDAGLESGKLLFDLEGFKLRGRFTLVRTARGGAESKEWLLIKKADAFASRDPIPHADVSVLSGRSLEELKGGGVARLAKLARAVERAGAKAGRVDAARVRPMLAERAPAAFSAPGWLFEVKYDGYRMLASAGASGGALYTRSGKSAAQRFPEVAQALAALPVAHAVLDGEIAAEGEGGRPSFQRLQQRAQLTRADEIARLAVEIPVTFHVFDLLGFGVFDLRDLPLARRKELLAELLPPVGPLRAVPHFEERGEEVYAQVQALGLEGIVAKRADSPYRSGRTSLWKKVRSLATADLAIVGFTAPAGSRSGFGALHLARAEAGGFVYTGRVGSGFSETDLVALRADLDALGRDTPACRDAPAPTRADHWVEPRLVCEVRYTEVTGDGLLRQPVFLRLRDDKSPEECVLEPLQEGRADAEPGAAPPDAGAPASTAAPVEAPRAARVVPFTNREKVFWPEAGFTKGDLIDYYRDISPWLLPYLADRPLVMTRFPDGIAGKSFFQKDAPSWAPPWVRTERMWSEETSRELRYFVCEDVESLLYVINLGTIPLHVWSSRLSSLQHPDWCILDLDPKGAPFAHVVEVARGVHALCEELLLPSYVKTSGSTGLHVLVPLGAQLTHEQSRSLAELLAQAVVNRLPQISTVARSLRKRDGKVYVDALQNGHGKLLVAPFSARPVPAASVSMPLRWREVRAGLDPASYHLKNAAARMRKLRGDPLAPVLREAPDLLGALERLGRELTARGRG